MVETRKELRQKKQLSSDPAKQLNELWSQLSAEEKHDWERKAKEVRFWLLLVCRSSCPTWGGSQETARRRAQEQARVQKHLSSEASYSQRAREEMVKHQQLKQTAEVDKSVAQAQQQRQDTVNGQSGSTVVRLFGAVSSLTAI